MVHCSFQFRDHLPFWVIAARLADSSPSTLAASVELIAYGSSAGC